MWDVLRDWLPLGVVRLGGLGGGRGRGLADGATPPPPSWPRHSPGPTRAARIAHTCTFCHVLAVVSICSGREFELPTDLCCPATPPPAQFNLTDTAIPEQIPRVRQRSALASGGYLEIAAGKFWSEQEKT